MCAVQSLGLIETIVLETQANTQVAEFVAESFWPALQMLLLKARWPVPSKAIQDAEDLPKHLCG
eukprot:8641483-Prorocentrum_lima.AAC.1